MTTSSADIHGGQARRLALLTEAVQINSVNPLQAGPRSGPGGEKAMAEWVGEHSRALGAEVYLDDVEPGRPNVYAFFEGTEDRTVAIDVHLDTVGIEHMTDDPFDGRVEDGKLFGRGSVDTKATFAVVLELMEEFAREGKRPRPNLWLVGTVGEERGWFTGADRFAAWLAESGVRLDGLVVAEPTMCAPVHGHKGGLGLQIVVHGKAVHSSRPELGENAIVTGSRIVGALAEEHERVSGLPAATPVGTGTVAVTSIGGGLAPNIIPDRCEIDAGRRIAPGEDPELVYQGLRQLVEQAAYPSKVEVELRDGKMFPGFFQPADSSIVQQLAASAESAPEVASYGSNALAYVPLLGQAIAEIALFGPGSIDQAHQAVEWVSIDELDRAAKVYRDWLLQERSA